MELAGGVFEMIRRNNVHQSTVAWWVCKDGESSNWYSNTG